MNRHVIKGRGKNRGKYLCYARHSREGDVTEDGFVWLPDQRKAARWDDPRYSGDTWATNRASLHNGFFVKLVAPKAITERVRELEEYIASHAAGATDALDCYWFSSDFHGAGQNYCRDCAEKVVDEKYAEDPARFEKLYGECEDDEDRYQAAIDGGFDTSHDSPPRCEKCGAKLSGNLTEYGADEALGALTTDCAPEFDDAEGWGELDLAIVNLSDDDSWWRKIARVVDASRNGERRASERAVALAATDGMAETRTAFLALLQERAVQKAPEPSFRLWDELRKYSAIPFEERYRPTKEVRALERRLLKEADVFAACLGYRWHGDTIKAPYGGYHWRFVIEIEQYRLWSPPAFVEGRAYGMSPCPSGDPEWPHHRDANPYKDERNAQWDAGYILGCYEREARGASGPVLAALEHDRPVMRARIQRRHDHDRTDTESACAARSLDALRRIGQCVKYYCRARSCRPPAPNLGGAPVATGRHGLGIK